MITHNTVTFLLWLLVAASSGTVGALLTWMKVRSQLDECCDCCKCDDCWSIDYGNVVDGCCIRCQRVNPADPCLGCYCHDEPERDDVDWPAHPGRSGFDIYGNPYGPSNAVSTGRRTVLLEPGPTIYRALVPLDDESLYGPERHVAASDSTWMMRMRLWMESEYPIPQDSPKGNM